MPSEIVVALIGLLGVIIGAIPTYFFMRQKNIAEIENLKSETERNKAEAVLFTSQAGKLNETANPDTKSTALNAKIIYELSNNSSSTDFDAKGVYWDNQDPSSTGKGALLLQKEILYIERTNLTGSFSTYIDKYHYDGKEKCVIPQNPIATGTRKLAVSCKVKTNKGNGQLSFRILEVQPNGEYVSPGHIETKEFGTIESQDWRNVEILFKVSPSSNYKIGFHYFNVSEPNILLMQNLLITERFVD